MISFRALAHAQSLLLLSFKKSARKIILYFLDFFLSHKYVWIKHSYYLGSLYIHTDSSNIIDKSSHFCCIPFLDTLYLHLQLFDRCRTSFFSTFKGHWKKCSLYSPGYSKRSKIYHFLLWVRFSPFGSVPTHLLSTFLFSLSNHKN